MVSALSSVASLDMLAGYAFSSADFATDTGIPLLRGINVTPEIIRWEDVIYWDREVPKELLSFQLQANDIVLGLDRPWVNSGTRVAVITEKDLPCMLVQRVCRIRPKKGGDYRFILHCIQSKAFEDTLSVSATGVSVPHISTKQIGNYVVAFPPEPEQKAICEYLERKCGQIGKMMEIKQKIIEKLQDYKKSLIYEVVTGKREV